MAFPIGKSGLSLRPLSFHPSHFRPQRPVVYGGDWRTQVTPDARQRIINFIVDDLKRHFPVLDPKLLHDLRNLAERFEGKHYSAATSMDDYLLRIAGKLVTMGAYLKTKSAAQSQKPSDGEKSSDDKKFSAISESLRSRL